MDGWMDEWMDRWMDGLIDEWMAGWMNGWLDGWMNGWMDGLNVCSVVTKLIREQLHHFIPFENRGVASKDFKNPSI